MLTIHESRVETFLSNTEFERFLSLVKQRHSTRASIARDAIKWYLENQDQLQVNERDTTLGQSMLNMTNRICGMLARQGVQLGTLFELAYQNHTDNGLQDKFIAATNTVKNKMRTRLTEDERALAEKMRRVVGSGNQA
jgi:hypothetical protein